MFLIMFVVILIVIVFYFLIYDKSVLEKTYCKVPITTPITGRYLRFSTSSTGQTIACNSIEVYTYENINTISKNIINASTIVTSSSVSSTTPLTNITDNDISTSFITNNTTSDGEWIQLDLGKNYTIAYIVFNTNTNINTFLINGLTLTIQNTDNKTVYTSSPFKDSTGSSTSTSIASLTPVPKQYKLYVLHPPHVNAMGHVLS